MAYPVVANWIRFKQVSDNKYEIINLLHDEKFEADAYTVWFIRQLNGKRDPYKIDKNKSIDDVDLILDELEAQSIIRDKRFLSKFFMNLLVTVWQPKVTPVMRLVSFIANEILLISFLPMLVVSILYYLNSGCDINADYIIIGSGAGILFGLVMHEFAHMSACLGYGGRVFEIGVMLESLFMPGAYVLMNKSNIKKRMRRVQVGAAGIEMNLFLTAVFLIMSVRIESLSGFFLGASIQNAIISLLNLTFVDGIDGMVIIGELLGVENFVRKAKNITKSRAERKKLIKDGISGRAVVMVCYAFRIIQIALPLIFALNIAGVISWFL